MTPSQATDTPQPLAVDYSGHPLHVGDTVAYIGTDPVALYQGRIVVTSPLNICVEAGPHLVTFSGIPESLSTRRPRPLDGTVSRNTEDETLRYPQVALTGTESRHSVSLFVGDSELPSDVVQGELLRGDGPRITLNERKTPRILFVEDERRRLGYVARVEELLAVIERVRAFATRLEEFGENALKDDDRKLYLAIAKDLRARIDGPTPNTEDGV